MTPEVLEAGSAANRRRFLSQTAAAGLVIAGAGVAHAAKPSTHPRRPPASPGRNPGRGAPTGGGTIEADRQRRRTSGLPELYPQWNHINFNQIQIDENQHVQFIASALGSAARPRPTFQGLEMPDIMTFAETSFVLENTGVAAYLGAAPIIFEKAYLAAAGSILTIEARHSGYLGTLLNRTTDLFSKSFDSPLTQEGVVSNAGPFLVSLNGGPPLSFSTTPSAENDIAILNFALALEYLEQEFYNINVPKFFG